MRTARTLIGVMAMAVAGAAVGLLLLTVATVPFGGRPATVLSGSMAPTLHRGDLVVALPIHPAQARSGDIVTFADPARPGRLITHRLVSGEAEGARRAMVTQGDANAVPERWTVATDGRIGRVAYRVPLVGHLVLAARSGPSGAFVLAAPLFLLALLELGATMRGARADAVEGRAPSPAPAESGAS